MTRWIALSLLCALAVPFGQSPAAFKAEGRPATERDIVSRIEAGEKLDFVDPKFVAAVRRIGEIRGRLEFDAAGNLVGADLSSDRISAGDAEVAHLLAMPHLRKVRLSGGGITREGIRQVAAMPGLTELARLNVQIDNDGLEQLSHLAGLDVARHPAECAIE